MWAKHKLVYIYDSTYIKYIYKLTKLTYAASKVRVVVTPGIFGNGYKGKAFWGAGDVLFLDLGAGFHR